MISKKLFDGLSVISVADIFFKESMKHLLGLRLRHLFKYKKLTKVVGQIIKFLLKNVYKELLKNISKELKDIQQDWKQPKKLMSIKIKKESILC